MKYKINNIYDDGYTLIQGNTLLSSDERLADILERAEDLDVIIEEDFGNRELFKTMLKEDNIEVYTYNLPKIYRSIYACFLANMTKYNNILSTLEAVESYNPSSEYQETKTFGEREKINEHGAKNETRTYGTINTTSNTGSSTDSTTNGQRQNTTAVSPSFGGSSFTPTGQDTGASSTDSTTYGARSDSEEITHGNDTVAHATYTDTQTEPETVDTVAGYKNLLKNIEEKYNVKTRLDLIKLIADDVANQITYNMYL